MLQDVEKNRTVEKKNVEGEINGSSPVENVDGRARLCAQGEPASRAGRSGLSKSFVFSFFYAEAPSSQKVSITKKLKESSFQSK